MAGGLVLGVGAAVTLAAWTDSEFAEGLFTAGSYNLEGSDDGVTYADQDTADGALSLSFSTLFDNLTPGDTTYASYWLRLDADTTTDATVTPAGVTGTDTNENSPNAGAISYTITQVSGGDCEAGEATGTVVAEGTTLNDQTGATAMDLVSNGAGTDGTPVQLCFAVTAGAEGSFQQGGATTAVWQFDSTSN
nr:SipW-dependent-type signal peptide-containing protein [Zhihengliuella flava]